MALSSYDIRFILSVSDRTGNSLRRVAGDMRGMTADANRMRKAFVAMDVGRGLQLRGLLGGAALGAAAQQAANFNTQVTKAASQIAGDNSVAKTAQNTIKLEEELLSLMGQFPASAQEQADAAYDIFSAMNVPLKGGVALLKLFNMVAVAGATDLETAANSMITILNNFGGSWDDAFKAVNTSFAVIRFGRLEFSEFNDMLNAVVPAAKAAGQSLEDISGAMAFVTKLIPSQKQGATAISRLLEVLSRTDFRQGAKNLGLEIEDMQGRLLPLPQIIGELARLDISQAQSTINSLFAVVTATGRGGGRGIQSTIQARRALILLVKEYKAYLETQKLVTGATTEFEKRYTAMIGSAGVKWERFKAQLQALLIMVGAAAIPMFEKLGEKVNTAVDWVKQHRGMVEFAVKATLVIAVASLLAGTLLKLYAAGLILFTGIKRLAMVTAPFLAGWARVTGILDRVAAVMFRMAPGLLLMTGRIAKFNGVLPFFTRNMLLAAASIAALKTAGFKGALGLLPLMGLLGKFAKIGVITVGVNVIMNLVNKEKRSRTAFLAKQGFLGSAALQAVFGTSFGTEKWFATDKGKRAIEEFDKKQQQARKGPMDKMGKNINNDFKKWMKEIQKGMKGIGGELFNKKMMKDLGFDVNALNEQVNNLINQPPGGTDKARFANEVASNHKELLKTATDKLVEVYQGFREANQQAFGNIFEPIEGENEEAQLRKAWNWTGGANNLLATMKQRLAQFREWRNSLTMLLKKGFSKDFVAEFKKMGPEGMKHLDELKKAGPKRVREFNAVFAASKTSITKATEIDFNAQVKKWNAHGKDTAFAIITGMESEEQNLQTRMNAMVVRLYDNVAMTIAQQQAKLNFVVPEPATGKFGLSPKTTAKTAPKGPTAAQIRAAGLEGRFAIPAAATGGLPVAAVQALGDRGTAMARAWGLGGSWPQPTLPGNTYHFHVNGTFLTEAEMMNQAMKQAAHKTKNKR